MSAAGVYAELWTSFASLLRSYTAAHGLNSRSQAVVEVGAEEILVRHGQQWLKLTQSGGRGTWGHQDGIGSDLALHEDGRVTLAGMHRHGETEEMDVVAERLAREIMR